MIEQLNTADTSLELGRGMHELITRLYPICRSITGDGVRRTLAIIAEDLPLVTSEVPTGTRVFDWTVPREWNIRDAFVKNSKGERVVDFHRSNLHVLNYSTPVRATMSLPQLRPHLFSDPAHPAAIPYRTSYYQENWGFCVSHDQLVSLQDDEYDVCIDSSLTDGALTYGECYLTGETTDEVLVSVHVCHPSLGNDNLSGISVAVFLARELLARRRRYSYRFLFIPGTIGAITWLARHQPETKRIRHGLVLTCVGDPGAFHYKRSRQGLAEIDRAVEHVLRNQNIPFEILDFSPYGYDERQYCSPGFDLPVGCFMRSIWGQFPEYHTSADDLQLVTPTALAESLRILLTTVELLEANRTYLSTNPFCEPALGRRGLYQTPVAGMAADVNLARLWVLNFADGRHSLLDVAERSGISVSVLGQVARDLAAHGLLVEEGPRHNPKESTTS